MGHGCADFFCNFWCLPTIFLGSSFSFYLLLWFSLCVLCISYRLDYEYYDGDGFSSSPYDYYHHYHHDDYYSPPTSPPPPNCSVIATVRGWLTHDHGGRLESVETGVALLVPPRALPPGPAAHLVYFKVCRQDHVRAVDTNGVPLDDGKGI
jgi:hypothetical protein